MAGISAETGLPKFFCNYRNYMCRIQITPSASEDFCIFTPPPLLPTTTISREKKITHTSTSQKTHPQRLSVLPCLVQYMQHTHRPVNNLFFSTRLPLLLSLPPPHSDISPKARACHILLFHSRIALCLSFSLILCSFCVNDGPRYHDVGWPRQYQRCRPQP